ncbi:MAG: BLUF domain-containing protein [Gemmatimonadaceae bacterium]|nr:BLUF domain-containing protein [Gemmatimonadaceae bacterium]
MGGTSAQHPIMTLTYRSRATAAMTPTRLRDLQRSAAARNRAEGVTGIVLYDDQRFFQWIEGPPDSIGRIWSSISRDVRHTDIDAISVHSSQTRLFSQWDLKLSLNRTELAGLLPDAVPLIVDPSAEQLATLAIGTDADAARAVLREAYQRLGTHRAITERLIEPAARHLGDLWSDDHCGEYEVALGLCRLQTYHA